MPTGRANTPSSKPPDLIGARGQFQVVGDDDEAGADLGVQLQHQFVDALRGVPIEVAGRLVRQHAVRARHQRPRDGRALALAAGEFAGLVPQPVPQPDPLQHLGARWRASDDGRLPISSGMATFSSAVNSGSR
jgi:hypothetical protein